MTFEQETRTILRELPGLLYRVYRHHHVSGPPHFAVVHGSQVDGLFESYYDANEAGRMKYGPDEPFLIADIFELEKTQAV